MSSSDTGNENNANCENSFVTLTDRYDPVPPLEEERKTERDPLREQKGENPSCPPRLSTAGGFRDISDASFNADSSNVTSTRGNLPLPQIRPRSPPPPRSLMSAMKPRSISPPPPPSSTSPSRTQPGLTDKIYDVLLGDTEDDDNIQMVPLALENDSIIETDQTFRSSTYPGATKTYSSSLAGATDAASREKQGSSARSVSDTTGSRIRSDQQGRNTSNRRKSGFHPGNFFADVHRNISAGASSNTVSATSSSLSPSHHNSNRGNFTSNITRKSVFIRNTLAKRSTATLSQLGSRGGSDAEMSRYASSSVVTTSSAGNNRRPHHQRANTISSGGSRLYRGYAQGDMVLVIPEDHPSDSSTTTTIMVNQYGYPDGEGSTLDEQSGPYLYILGKVKKIHYEENAVFYTITREDNGEDIRGDAGYMEPIRTQAGLDAARKAAIGTHVDVDLEDGSGANGKIPEEKRRVLQCIENVCVVLLLPFIWTYDIFVFVIGARLFRWGVALYQSSRTQGNLFLNGLPPYTCAVRLTTVNIIVLCTIWYMFIDQMRLAFFPASADYSLAVINLVIWTILTLDLILEVFIRPESYFHLIQSEKAFTPATVRYISWIHLFIEAVSLGFFAPEFACLFRADLECDGRPYFSFIRSTLMTITGPTAAEAFAGKAFYACVRLRVFGLVRHWRNMWVRTTFIERNAQVHYVNDAKSENRSLRRISAGYGDNNSVISAGPQTTRNMRLEQKQRDAALINASNIGTALMVTNSYRSLMMLCLVMGTFPMIPLIYWPGVVDSVGVDMVHFLQGTNVQMNVENLTNCQYLTNTVASSLEAFSSQNQSSITTNTDAFLLEMAIKPSRCIEYFANLTVAGFVFYEGLCPSWSTNTDLSDDMCIIGQLEGILGNSSIGTVAHTLNLRVGNTMTETTTRVNESLTTEAGFFEATSYEVSANYNYTYSTEAAALMSFLMQLCLLLSVLLSLIVLRYDAEHLVLRPLRSMLKIVARYAKNPLAQGTPTGRDNSTVVSKAESEHSADDDASEGDGFGTYETEQLISAVSKITDLLRKCWGVAGADIISTNLASREGELAEVFNPTVPGKSVYALFAFAAINGFDHALKCLGGDVMILINDVAQVVHSEVFRWGFGDSGQCNKNLGSAFLMVFRIGLVKEVVEKLEEATRVVFSSNDVKKVIVRKKSRDKLPAHVRNKSGDNSSPYDRLRPGGLKPLVQTKRYDSMTDAMQLSLQSLPGISTFTDRAVLGMLKSFAGIHRDKKLRNWSRDFRLSAGVGAWSVDMIFGMDAGWAVEGAVGSEYKIDATYLSPHVNMASRMMSACKHYGVTILLSEAVQELMSVQAKSRLRKLDRVTVKGSTQVQNIYTYDARSKGADFFLYSRSDEQADLDAERYEPNIWLDDQDLKAMRHHVTDDFEKEFTDGMKFYYEGNWPEAVERLERANEIMVDAAMEEGYLHDEMDDSQDRKELYRTQTGDGPCKYLISFMKSQGSVAPPSWAGWHPLLSKYPRRQPSVQSSRLDFAIASAEPPTITTKSLTSTLSRLKRHKSMSTSTRFMKRSTLCTWTELLSQDFSLLVHVTGFFFEIVVSGRHKNPSNMIIASEEEGGSSFWIDVDHMNLRHFLIFLRLSAVISVCDEINTAQLADEAEFYGLEMGHPTLDFTEKWFPSKRGNHVESQILIPVTHYYTRCACLNRSEMKISHFGHGNRNRGDE